MGRQTSRRNEGRIESHKTRAVKRKKCGCLVENSGERALVCLCREEKARQDRQRFSQRPIHAHICAREAAYQHGMAQKVGSHGWRACGMGDFLYDSLKADPLQTSANGCGERRPPQLDGVPPGRDVDDCVHISRAEQSVRAPGMSRQGPVLQHDEKGKRPPLFQTHPVKVEQ